MGCSNSLQRSSSYSWRSDSKPLSAQDEFKKNWRILHKLGEGSFAEIYAVKYKASSRCAAVKFQKRPCYDRDNKKEAMIWRKIGQHDHVVNLVDDFVLGDRHVMLMEKCDYSLSERLTDLLNASEAALASLFYQMTSAISHLESLSIVHRDVKPENFLCAGSYHIPKLCDFGCAAIMPTSHQLYGTYGTPIFMSPEMVGDGPHNLKTDVWSLGATFYLVLFGEYPYCSSLPKANHMTIMRKIAIGFPEPQYQGRADISDEAKEVVSALLHRTMIARISATEALKIPFLSSASKRFSIRQSVAAELDSQSTRDMGTHVDDWTSADCDSTESSEPCSPRQPLVTHFTL